MKGQGGWQWSFSENYGGEVSSQEKGGVPSQCILSRGEKARGNSVVRKSVLERGTAACTREKKEREGLLRGGHHYDPPQAKEGALPKGSRKGKRRLSVKKISEGRASAGNAIKEKGNWFRKIQKGEKGSGYSSREWPGRRKRQARNEVNAKSREKKKCCTGTKSSHNKGGGKKGRK